MQALVVRIDVPSANGHRAKYLNGLLPIARVSIDGDLVDYEAKGIFVAAPEPMHDLHVFSSELGPDVCVR